MVSKSKRSMDDIKALMAKWDDRIDVKEVPWSRKYTRMVAKYRAFYIRQFNKQVKYQGLRLVKSRRMKRLKKRITIMNPNMYDPVVTLLELDCLRGRLSTQKLKR